MYTTLINAEELARIIADPNVRVVDCRFDLGDTQAGRGAFLDCHISGAVYAHLDEDLSANAGLDLGRHPLPEPSQIAQNFGRLGIHNEMQVVAYDDAGGMIAARLWWMLRYMGHRQVAVLDGGWQQWLAHEGSCERGNFEPATATFSGQAREDRLVALDELDAAMQLVDARAPERFRGEIEPLDPRPGHIPGALNRFFKDNLDPHGRFSTPDQLKHALTETLGTLPDSESVHMCGSGVSACHNILAQVHAGLPEPRLYGGSWSEWCADPKRPAALG